VFFAAMTFPPLLTAAAFLLLTTTAPAALKMYGASKFAFSAGNSKVTFGCGGINNSSAENATGTIMVRLWALDKPYAGGTLNGKVLASYKLDGLNPKAYYSPVSQSVAATMPATRKAYHLCLTVMEYQASGYVISDYRNFDGTTVLGPLKTFTLSGPWSWQTHPDAGTLDIKVAKIAHTRTGNTGTLKLSVWATKSPYKGGSLSGFELGSVSKAALKPGYTYSDVTNTAKYKKPPAGTYYVHILLAEFQNGGYKTVAYLTSGKTTSFK
jgi:hypothetical protein